MENGKMANVDAAAVMHNGQWLKISDRDEVNNLQNQINNLNNNLDSSWKFFGRKDVYPSGFAFAFYRLIDSYTIEVYGTSLFGDDAIIYPPSNFTLNRVTYKDGLSHGINIVNGGLSMGGNGSRGYISISKI